MAKKQALWPGDYRAIQAWGIHLLSFEYYIREQQMKAFKDGAPLDAIYFREDRGWVRLTSCVPEVQKIIKYIMGWMK